MVILNKIEPTLKFEGVCDCGNCFTKYITLSKFKNDENKCILKCSKCDKKFNASNLKIKKVNDSEKGVELKETNND